MIIKCQVLVSSLKYPIGTAYEISTCQVDGYVDLDINFKLLDLFGTQLSLSIRLLNKFTYLTKFACKRQTII